MEQENGGLVLVISTVLILLVLIALIILFTVFQSRKNKLIQEREENKKRFEKEIAETQIEIREETLRNISWELHDNIGQLLTLAKIQLQQATLKNIEETAKIITKSLQEVRALSKVVNPDFINNIRLKEALKLEVDRFNRLNYIDATLTIIGDEFQIDQKHGIVIFRMFQEFFSNTIKHSKASKLSIEIKYQKNQLEVKAKDNGVGFEVDTAHLKSLGLRNMQARAKLINAKIKLTSKLQSGTSLIINYYI